MLIISFISFDYTLKIELSGHTDTRGSSSSNKTLSQNRAKAVVDYLTDKGIAASRMVSKGYGEEKTIVSDAEIAKMLTKEEKASSYLLVRELALENAPENAPKKQRTFVATSDIALTRVF